MVLLCTISRYPALKLKHMQQQKRVAISTIFTPFSLSFVFKSFRNVNIFISKAFFSSIHNKKKRMLRMEKNFFVKDTLLKLREDRM